MLLKEWDYVDIFSDNMGYLYLDGDILILTYTDILTINKIQEAGENSWSRQPQTLIVLNIYNILDMFSQAISVPLRPETVPSLMMNLKGPQKNIFLHQSDKQTVTLACQQGETSDILNHSQPVSTILKPKKTYQH